MAIFSRISQERGSILGFSAQTTNPTIKREFIFELANSFPLFFLYTTFFFPATLTSKKMVLQASLLHKLIHKE
jgi:hypothetical protein